MRRTVLGVGGGLVLVPLVLASVLHGASAEGPFEDLTFDQACHEAAKSGKVVFIDFFTTWCGPCKKLDKTTWKDEHVVAWLEEHTIPLKIDAEKEVQLAKRYEIDRYPSLLFIESGGEVIGRMTGYRSAQDFLAQAPDVLAGIKPSDSIREELAKDPDSPSLRSDLADALIDEKNYEEALDLYLWCFDHGDDDPSRGYGGVRLSFLIGDLADLAKKYPPTRGALCERRDAAQDAMLGIQSAADAVQDFVALNRGLGETELTLKIYDQLASMDHPTSKGQVYDPRPLLFDAVLGLLMKAERYRDVVSGFGDPEQWFAGEVERLEASREALQEYELREDVARVLRGQVVSKACKLYQALAATGENDEGAQNLVHQLADLDGSVHTWRTLMRSARNAGRRDFQEQLRAEALSRLPEQDHKRIPKVRD